MERSAIDRIRRCKISVIVPIYKAEKTLSKCISSILEQSLPDFELLLIDDGSLMLQVVFVKIGPIETNEFVFFISKMPVSVLPGIKD